MKFLVYNVANIMTQLLRHVCRIFTLVLAYWICCKSHFCHKSFVAEKQPIVSYIPAHEFCRFIGLYQLPSHGFLLTGVVSMLPTTRRDTCHHLRVKSELRSIYYAHRGRETFVPDEHYVLRVTYNYNPLNYDLLCS